MKNLWVVVWKSGVVFGIAACLCGTVPSAFAQDAAQEKEACSDFARIYYGSTCSSRRRRQSPE